MGSRTVALVITLWSVSACGNLSNEDLIFLQALPRAEEIALEVKDGQAQNPNALTQSALVGERAEYYDVAYNLASNINGGVELILDLVDRLGRGAPPTERSENRRTWGPGQGDGGRMFRLDIVRTDAPVDDSGLGPLVYEFCLQYGLPESFDRSRDSCGEDNDQSLLWGSYRPRIGEDGANAGARSGAGQVVLNFALKVSVDGPGEDAPGLLVVDYDFSGGGLEKMVSVDWTHMPIGQVPQDFEYHYLRDDTANVSISFAWVDDLVGGGLANPTSLEKERAVLNACWQEGGTGRAEVLITQGDLGTDGNAFASECWDASILRTYFIFESTRFPEYNDEEGDSVSCSPCAL